LLRGEGEGHYASKLAAGSPATGFLYHNATTVMPAVKL
jgi:hypothetical protein